MKKHNYWYYKDLVCDIGNLQIFTCGNCHSFMYHKKDVYHDPKSYRYCPYCGTPIYDFLDLKEELSQNNS